MINSTLIRKLIYYILLSFSFSFIACSVSKKIDGKYVNIKNIYNDYYIIDLKQKRFEHHNDDIVSKGTILQDESVLIFKNDSVNYFQNLDLKFGKPSNENASTNLLLSTKGNSFQKFKLKNPDIKLYFVGFFETEKGVNSLLIEEVKSESNIYKLPEFKILDFNSFQLIGLNYSCMTLDLNRDCFTINKTFQSKKYSFGNNIEIDLNSIMSHNFELERRIKATDTLCQNKYFIIDGKTYTNWNDR